MSSDYSISGLSTLLSFLVRPVGGTSSLLRRVTSATVALALELVTLHNYRNLKDLVLCDRDFRFPLALCNHRNREQSLNLACGQRDTAFVRSVIFVLFYFIFIDSIIFKLVI